MVALECVPQGVDREVDQNNERFLVDIRNVRSFPPVLIEVLENIRDGSWLQHRGQK